MSTSLVMTKGILQSNSALTDGHGAKGPYAWELTETETGHCEESRATHDDALLHLMVLEMGKTSLKS